MKSPKNQYSDTFLKRCVFTAIPTLRRRATAPTSVDDRTNDMANFVKDDTVLVSLAMDPSAFHEPHPLDSYLLFGFGSHNCFGKAVNLVAIPAIVKTILSKIFSALVAELVSLIE